MNKLVIVGNGFDLAHGLSTSYCHFMDDFWENLSKNYKEEFIKKDLVYVHESYDGLFNYNKISDFTSFLESLKECCKDREYKLDTSKYIVTHYGSRRNIRIFEFRNDFFKEINIHNSINNWVDIENLYYDKLKEITKAACIFKEKKEQAIKLNSEFEQVKKIFEEYLNTKINDVYDFKNITGESNAILENFKIERKNLADNQFHEYLEEFSLIDHEDLINFDRKICEAYNDGSHGINSAVQKGKISQESLFLNFNYTSSIDRYVEIINNKDNRICYGKARQIQIHGKLDYPGNVINFGFGDEMDEDYKSIENINDNEFLRNFKSFLYLQNKNYKNLLEFINGEKFQVYIMGHSCGLSDRTLLNTIFEHDNCRSIKVFYHQFKEGDNYTEIIQNISRHFNDKKLMREKVVNKILCKPFPQDIRFSKK